MNTNLDTRYNTWATFVLMEDENFVNEVLQKISPEQPNLELTIQVNGVELNAELFKSAINNLMNRIDDSFKETYSDLDKLAEDKARAIIEEKADIAFGELDKLRSLVENLKDIV